MSIKIILEEVTVNESGYIFISDDQDDNETSWHNQNLNQFAGQKGHLVFIPHEKNPNPLEICQWAEGYCQRLFDPIAKGEPCPRNYDKYKDECNGHPSKTKHTSV